MLRLAVIAALCIGAVPGCSAPPPTHPPVPATFAEDVPVPPTSPVAQIWRPGHYDWTGTEYVWIPGEWVERAGHSSLWQDGYWRESGSAEVWIPAHWL